MIYLDLEKNCSRFRVTLNAIDDKGIDVPLVYILCAKNVNPLYDHYQALERVHKWAEYQMRVVNRNVISYSVECLDV